MKTKFSKKFTEDEIEIRTKRINKARDEFAKERSLNTKKNDQILLNCLERYQKLTLKQIQEIFSGGEKKDIFQRSFLLNALKRLEDKQLIFSRTSKDIIKGKIIKSYFYKFVKNQDETEIVIPKNTKITFLEKTLEAYSITNDKIIITSADNEDISKRAIFSEPISIIKSYNEVKILKLPPLIIRFYELYPGTFYFDKEILSDLIILKKIKILKTSNKEKQKIDHLKKILLLEDHISYGNDLVKKLKKEGHTVELVRTVTDFENILKKDGKTFDIISLDRRIDNEHVAKQLSYEIKYNAPQAKVGLLTGTTLTDEEKDEFQNLDFDYILPKKSKIKTGFSQVGEELVAWLRAI